MTERERLIRIIEDSKVMERCGCHYNNVEKYINELTDYLLKNGVIVPPCKVGQHLWRVTQPHRRENKVTEFVVKNIRTVGRKHKIMLEVQALNVGITNVMGFDRFYLTREEAEKALEESDKE